MIDFEEFKERYQKVPVEEYPNCVVETMPEPVVSVHVSTYQHADFIHDCMEGVLMQETDFPYEIIIGEDESDDGTREICKQYAEKYPEKIRLFLHRRENNIAIHGRPTGRFQFVYSHFMARGKYIAICEGDDRWTDTEKLQKQVDFLEANEEYVASCHDAKVVDGSGDLLEESKLPAGRKQDASREDLMNGALLLTLTICYRNVISEYPEEYFKVLNGDIFLISILGQHGKAKYQSNVHPPVYREHGGGIWSKKSTVYTDKEYANTMEKLKKYYDRIGEHDISDEFLGKAMWCYSKVYKSYLENGHIKEFTTFYFHFICLCVKEKKLKLAVLSIKNLLYF